MKNHVFWHGGQERPKYAQSSEVDLSGVSPNIGEIAKGIMPPIKVEIYYQNGEPKRLRARYDDRMDVYLSGMALEDFLRACF